MVAVAAIVASCTTNGSAQPAPDTASPQASRPTSSGATTSVRQSAPRVPNPIESASYLADPCRALSVERATALGLPAAGKRLDAGSMPGCDWYVPPTSPVGMSVGITFITMNKNGLEDIYSGGQKGRYRYFEPTVVAGHPAVFSGIADLRLQGDCSIAVGLTDQLVATAKVQISNGSEKGNPCPVAARAAEAMIATMRGGS
nr:DUF3558 domain-containing protein [Herbihabitans rhizosphaerae]